MLTCTFNGWIILWTKGRVPSKRPPPTFLRNLRLRGGGRLQGTLQYTHFTQPFQKPSRFQSSQMAVIWTSTLGRDMKPNIHVWTTSLYACHAWCNLPPLFSCVNVCLCVSRVPDQNGVSLLYIEGFRPEWCISTIYRGFPTRMVYLYYISRVSDQNGVSLLYIEGFRPECCIS